MKKILAIAALSALSLPALAQQYGTRQYDTQSTQRIDQRQANQQQRIEEGVRSGQLTWREAERLREGQRQIRRMERRALADGYLSPQEQARIEDAQNRQSQVIARFRHNDRVNDRAQY